MPAVVPTVVSPQNIYRGTSNIALTRIFYDDLEKMRVSDDMPEDLRLRIASARNKHIADYKAGRTRNKWTTMNELTIIARYMFPEGFASFIQS